MRLVVHIDGGARGNPGPAGVGVVVQTEDDGTFLFRKGYYLGSATNNVAEYTGLLRGIELSQAMGRDQLAGVTFFSDSQLMVNQVNGNWKVKTPHIRSLHQAATKALADLPDWKLTHVRREQNQYADELANMAMDARADVDLDGE